MNENVQRKADKLSATRCKHSLIGQLGIVHISDLIKKVKNKLLAFLFAVPWLHVTSPMAMAQFSFGFRVFFNQVS